MIEYKRETVAGVLDEIKPLLQKHWEEIAHYKDIPFAPDYDQYLKADLMGMVRVYIAREEGVLIGYSVYFVRPNLHYSTSLQAYQDLIYVDKSRRGFGLLFMLWCDKQLKADGVQVVATHIKAAHNFGPALERIGYELMDLIYVKRLDK